VADGGLAVAGGVPDLSTLGLRDGAGAGAGAVVTGTGTGTGTALAGARLAAYRGRGVRLCGTALTVTVRAAGGGTCAGSWPAGRDRPTSGPMMNHPVANPAASADASSSAGRHHAITYTNVAEGSSWPRRTVSTSTMPAGARVPDAAAT
jgi:hypothetical protein